METENEVKASSSGEDFYINKVLKSGPIKVLSSMDGKSSKLKSIDDILTTTDSPKSARSYQKGMRKKDRLTPKRSDSGEYKLTPKRSDCGENKLTPKCSDCGENKLTPKRTDNNETEGKSCLKNGQPKALFLDDEDDCLGTMTLKEMCRMMKKSKSGQKKAGKENSTPVKTETRSFARETETDNVESLKMDIYSSADVIPQRVQTAGKEVKSGSVDSTTGSLARESEPENVVVPVKDSCETVTMEIDSKGSAYVVTQKPLPVSAKQCRMGLGMDVGSPYEIEVAELETKSEGSLLRKIDSRLTYPMSRESGDLEKHQTKDNITERQTKSRKRKSETDCQASDDDDDVPLSVWQLNKKHRRDKKLRKESENINDNAELLALGAESTPTAHSVVKPEVFNSERAGPSNQVADRRATPLHSDVKLTPCKETDFIMTEVDCDDDAGLKVKASQTSEKAIEVNPENALISSSAMSIASSFDNSVNTCTKVFQESKPKEKFNIPSTSKVEKISTEDIHSGSENNQIKVSGPVQTDCPDSGTKPKDFNEMAGTGKLHLHLPDDSSDVEFVQSDEPTPTPTLDTYSSEKIITEEAEEGHHMTPSKIPHNRNSFSPLSREKLLQASKLGLVEQDLPDNKGLKKLPRPYKSYQSRDSGHLENTGSPSSRAKANVSHRLSSPQKMGRPKEETLPGSPLYNQEKPFTLKSPLSKMHLNSPAFGDMTSPVRQSSPHSQNLSNLFNNPPSPSPQQMLSPVKGILRSASKSCHEACKCEECLSIRSRAEKAAEFSQRQMHDIEGLAVKLLKELSTMRGVLEENLVHSMSRVESPHSSSRLHKSKAAVSNALETERMAKSWLVRMARDCNRYCKIMRMQERKLTFADESGGQLCHVKLLHSQASKEKPESFMADKTPKTTPVQSS